MYPLKIKYSKVILGFCLFLYILLNNENLLSQNKNEVYFPSIQKYQFENKDISILLECYNKYIFKNDSCLVKFSIKNKLNNDIYLLNRNSWFSYSSFQGKLIDATVDFGGNFSGEIDTYTLLKIIKPNEIFSDKLALYSNKIDTQYKYLGDIFIKISLGYLDCIDSLYKHYPENTSIKTEKISDDILRTSSNILNLYLKRIEVGSLLLEYEIKKEK